MSISCDYTSHINTRLSCLSVHFASVLPFSGSLLLHTCPLTFCPSSLSLTVSEGYHVGLCGDALCMAISRSPSLSLSLSLSEEGSQIWLWGDFYSIAFSLISLSLKRKK